MIGIFFFFFFKIANINIEEVGEIISIHVKVGGCRT